MRIQITHWILAAGLSLMAPASWSAPGEDTIQLKNPVEHLQLPIGGAAVSKGLDQEGDGIPTSLKAKIVRYEAKTFSDQKDGIYTDGDVNRMVETQANRKTCIQDVGSNVAPPSGVGGRDQIVVLRGDLVNICR